MNLAASSSATTSATASLKWAQATLGNVRVFPPGTGIIHQVNLERIASVVRGVRDVDDDLAFPDFVIGGDSHTPMVNALGVLGWGVGGIDAEAPCSGCPTSIPVPEVVGVRLLARRRRVPPPPISRFS